MIQLGTSGFSCRDWLGPFYPPGVRERDWLAFYAREVSTVELDVTFYRLPAAAAVAAWIERTPAGFVFAVNAFRWLTHERRAPDFAGFAAAVRPLAEAGKLACVLAQFPRSFRRTPQTEGYLLRLRKGLGELLAAVEFRHAEWVSEATDERLRQRRLGLSFVDEPRLRGLIPPAAMRGRGTSTSGRWFISTTHPARRGMRMPACCGRCWRLKIRDLAVYRAEPPGALPSKGRRCHSAEGGCSPRRVLPRQGRRYYCVFTQVRQAASSYAGSSQRSAPSVR